MFFKFLFLQEGHLFVHKAVGCSIVVEQSLRHLKVKGSSLAAATGTGIKAFSAKKFEKEKI